MSKGVDSKDAFVNSFSLKTNSFAQLTADFEVAWKRYTRDLTPNTISQVTENMNFLAHGLLWIKKSKRPTPDTTAALRADLQRVNYRISRTVHGIQTHFSATDESLYRYDLPNGNTTMLSMVQSRDNRLPPIISAPGLKPSPTLVWYYMDGDLMYDVTYK